MLEAIKDCTQIDLKYQIEVLRYKKPNIVIVFSNNDPDVMQLSRDWCQIFNITKRDLNAMTDVCLRERKCKFILCLWK